MFNLSLGQKGKQNEIIIGSCKMAHDRHIISLETKHIGGNFVNLRLSWIH